MLFLKYCVDVKSNELQCCTKQSSDMVLGGGTVGRPPPGSHNYKEAG